MTLGKAVYPLLLGVVVVTLVFTLGRGGPEPEEPLSGDALAAAFEASYQAYRESPSPAGPSSVSASPEAIDHLRHIAVMGPGVLPYLIAEARRTGDITLTLPLGTLGNVSFRRADWAGGAAYGGKEGLRFFIEWWDGGQAGADRMFAEAYEAGDMERIGALGWGVMPRIVEKLREGDDSLMEPVRQIALRGTTGGRIPESAVTDAPSWLAYWDANREKWEIPFPDKKPAQ